MIFFKGSNKFNNSVLIRNFFVNAICENSINTFDEVSNMLGGDGMLLKSILFRNVHSFSSFFVEYFAMSFTDYFVVIRASIGKAKILQKIPVVSREQIMSGEPLPEHVALYEDDLNLVRILYERGCKISWNVQHLTAVGNAIFLYNFEHLVVNPFGLFIYHYDGSFVESSSLDELLVHGRLAESKNKKIIGFSPKRVARRFFVDKYLATQRDRYHKKFENKKSVDRISMIAWYNILSITYGLWLFSNELYGKRSDSSKPKEKSSSYSRA